MITTVSSRAGCRAPTPPPTSACSASLFDAMVSDGRMPQPKRINSRVVWDRWELDAAFDALSDCAEVNPWDNAA